MTLRLLDFVGRNFLISILVATLIGIGVAFLTGGCQTIDNWRTEANMYEIELINGLPTHHGHLENGAPYED